MYGPNHPDRLKLNNQIRDWNSNRLDLFEISEPNEYLEFYGVMRFFYQGEDLKYQTKCLRVSSTATTLDLIEAVVVKFHPDLKMLSNDRYALYENHNLQDRKMKDNEHPLIVQLNWAFDDKDGKFILRNESRRRRSTDLTGHVMLNNYGMSKSTSALGSNGYDSQTLRSQSSAVYSTSSSNFFSKRMLSSKKSKRRGKSSVQDSEEAQRMAAELSGKPPESSFTRTISNPDEVMKRRRQRKLESRLEQFSTDNETGGTLKIYGDSINPDIPYKTLLLSVNDTAEKVLTETLDKYGLAHQDHRFYVLVQQNIPPKTDRQRGEMPGEIILHDQDCPLGILVHTPPKRGNATFAVRRRTPMDKLPSKPRMPPFSVSSESLQKSPTITSMKSGENDNYKSLPKTTSSSSNHNQVTKDYPRLIKLLIDEDGNLFDEDEVYSLTSLINGNMNDISPTEGSKFIKIGSQPSAVGNYPNILFPKEEFPDIRPTHCHISAKLDPKNIEIKIILTPTLDSSSRIPKPCIVYINREKIENSTKLEDDDIIQIGESILFRFENPDTEQRSAMSRSSNATVEYSKEDPVESMQINYLTADLPVTVKHSYNLSEQLIDSIMVLSKNYAEKGGKDLFSCNSDPRFHNMDELFRLAPAYMFYLVLRSGLGKEQHVSNLINIIAHDIENVIQEDKNSVEKEVFWLSNTSELLHLLQCDNDLRHYSGSAQDVFASAIEQAFTILQSQFSQDLMILLPAFIDEDDSDQHDDAREDTSPCLDRASMLINFGDIDYPIQHLLQTLSLAFTLFHNCQVNVALTIQMFSQLFHLLNTWLFNAVLGDTSNGYVNEPLSVCPEWGARLTRRLTRIRDWSETNGLEMAANCHLQKMYQVAELMEADKRDLNAFGEKCLELININGTQLYYLLENCEDIELPNAWIEVVVNTAIQLHDQAFNNGVPQNKSKLPLFEDMDLRLPLLLPADGYCCDRGIVSCPKDLKNMLDDLEGIITYKLIPPTTNQIDTRWKSYLGPYENTPSVSRSNTIVEQSPLIPLRGNSQQGLPRNIINDERSSMALSSTDSQYDSKPSSKIRRVQEPRSKRPSELPIKKETSLSIELTDVYNDDSVEVFKGDLKNRYKLKLKKINNSLGLSIIAARTSPNDIFRIYIKDVINGGAGHKSGRIETGDQLVSVDGLLLENINQDEAVEFMKKTNSTVNLLMEKGAAERHGVLDIILRAKSLKATLKKQSTTEVVKLPKGKPVSNSNKAQTIKSVPNIQPPQRHTLRENVTVKKPQPVEIENRKRSDYKLPPVPYVKAPPRPARVPPNIRNKMSKVNDEELSDQEYHSLPVRKNRNSQSAVPKNDIYGTVTKGKSPRDTDETTYYSLQGMNNKPKQTTSQPNLARIMPKKRLDTPLSSDSGSSQSISTSDEENSEENRPPVTKPNNQNKKNISLYTKVPPPPPPPPQLNRQKQKNNTQKLPTKALSDNNIQLSGRTMMPKSEITSSNSPLNERNSKNKFLSRPVIAPMSEPIMNNDSESSFDNVKLKDPVQLSKSKKKRQSSTSESESETLSSVTQSFSSDQSPKPQKKINSEPIVSLKSNGSTISNGINSGSNNVKIKNISRDDSRISEPMKTPEQPRPTQSKVDVTFNDSKVDMGRYTPSIPNSLPIQISPPPVPTALHPQYHPPSELEEKDWTMESKRPVIKPPTEEEIKMRRKAIEDRIRSETEMRHKSDQDLPSPPNSRSQSVASIEMDKPSPTRNSTRYGRPQFKDKTIRPESEITSPTNDMQKGIIIPAYMPAKPQTIGSNEVYTNPYKKPQNNQQVKTPESAEQLSFKDKIKLFAEKNGEVGIVNRNKFSSKQLRIESGDFS